METGSPNRTKWRVVQLGVLAKVGGGREGQRAVRVRLVGGRGSVAGGSLGAGGQRVSGGLTSWVPAGMSGVAGCARSRRTCRTARSALENWQRRPSRSSWDRRWSCKRTRGLWTMVARRSRSSRCCWLAEAEVSRTVLRAALRAAGRRPAESKRRPGRPLAVRVPSRGRTGRSGRCGVRVSAERWADAAGMCCTSIWGRAFSRSESFGRPGSGGQVLQDRLEFRPRGDGWGGAEEVLVAALSARREGRSKV